VRVTPNTVFATEVDLRVRDTEHGREILRALGMDATQRAATFRLPSQLLANPRLLRSFGLGVVVASAVAALVGMMVSSRLSATPLTPLLVLPGIALAAFAILLTTRATVTVGADGILVASPLRRRFYRLADVATVTTFADPIGSGNRAIRGVELVLRSRETVRIVVSDGTSGISDRGETQTELVAERIREALESARRGDPAHDAARLGRNARAVGDWVRALRALAAGAVDHRTAPIPEDRLWRVIENPNAAPGARAGASVALAPSLDEAGRARVRVAAQATASPKLRVALEAAAAPEADEAALEHALAELDAEEHRAAK
jgi:hypothetical protein